jgi:hypothetical protein
MQETYRYVIHAYEDARQKRPMKHQHGGTTDLTDGPKALGRALSHRDRDAVADEGEHLLTFVASEAKAREIEFTVRK